MTVTPILRVEGQGHQAAPVTLNARQMQELSLREMLESLPLTGSDPHEGGSFMTTQLYPDACSSFLEESYELETTKPVTVTPPSTITVQSPNGNENWLIGEGRTIQWSSQNVTGPVRIELSRTGPNGPFETLLANTANDGSENWTVTGPATTQAVIKITSVTNPAVTDLSDGVFTIGASTPTVQITSTAFAPPAAGIGEPSQLQVHVTHSPTLEGQPITVAITRTGTSSGCVVSSPVGGEPEASQTKMGASTGQLSFTFTIGSGEIDSAACPGTATYQASVSSPGATDQTASDANQATLTLQPSLQIVSTTFDDFSTTVGQAGTLRVQVRHSAGFAPGASVTVGAQVSAQSDPGIIASVGAPETLSIQSAATKDNMKCEVKWHLKLVVKPGGILDTVNTKAGLGVGCTVWMPCHPRSSM